MPDEMKTYEVKCRVRVVGQPTRKKCEFMFFYPASDAQEAIGKAKTSLVKDLGWRRDKDGNAVFTERLLTGDIRITVADCFRAEVSRHGDEDQQ